MSSNKKRRALNRALKISGTNEQLQAELKADLEFYKALAKQWQLIAEIEQMEIYNLMAEFCPERLTEDMKKDWAEHQRPVTGQMAEQLEEISDLIDFMECAQDD